MSLTRASSMAFHTSFVIMTMTMFGTHKDFGELAHQIALSSRGPTTDRSKNTIHINVYQIRLWKLIHTPDRNDLEALAEALQCNQQELVHTIAALYDRALSEIGGETIYETICERKTVTILITLDDPSLKQKQTTICPIITDEEDCLDTLLESIEYPDSVFKPVFSDPSSEEEEEEEDAETPGSDSNDRDYSVGIKKYLKKVKSGKLSLPKRLIACMSFQKTTLFPLPTQEEHVIDLQLMACRKKYRGRGLGRYLIKMLMNQNYIGDYDAIITASDQDAISFYRKFGFTEDPILLAKYKDIGDSWTNTTKMCYLPAYHLVHDDPIRCLTMMDDQFHKWQKAMFNGYQSQAALFSRLKNEMIGLYAKINAQEQTIQTLNRERFLLVKENAALKLKLNSPGTTNEQHISNAEHDSLDTQKLIEEMEKISISNEKLLTAQICLLMDENCQPNIAAEYCSYKMKSPEKYRIKAKKVNVDDASKALYQSSLVSMAKPNETLLFYSGHHEHLDIIGSAGFTSDDFLYGAFGKGLYFRSTVSNVFIPKILLCKVILGRTESIPKSKTKSSVTLKRNPEFDSIKIFDLDMIEDGDEIVLFDSHRVLPIFMLTIETIS